MNYHLAQLNIAQLLAPLDSPQLKDFVDNLERINTLAEQSEGFIWRLQTEEGDATALRPFGEEVIVNLSVWASVEALHQFVYRSAHAPIMSRRREWFARMANTYMVLWWIPEGHEPTVEEAKQRLDLLQNQGASAQAFSFKQVFEQPSKAF